MSEAIDAVVLREALPPEMLNARRWLLYDRSKIPHYIDGTWRSGVLDAPEDTARLATLDAAIAALNGRHAFAGVGFALGAGWQGIDLDAHREPASGDLSELARRIVDECGSYTEISPSGRGIHVIGYGEPFPAIGKAATDHRIEAYAGGRFFTVTGHALRNAGEAADLRPIVERLRAKFVRVNGASARDETPDDTLRQIIHTGADGVHDALVKLAARLVSRGVEGEDVAAALYSLMDAAEWRERDAKRWSERRARVADIARSAYRKYADPRQERSDEPHGDRTPVATAWPAPLNLRALSDREPQPPQFIMRDWLPAGYGTLLAGHGGVGKSAIGLHIAACIALGVPYFGIETERSACSICRARIARTCCIGDSRTSRATCDHARRSARRARRGRPGRPRHRAMGPRSAHRSDGDAGLRRLAQRIEQSQTHVLVVDGVSRHVRRQREFAS